MLSCYLQTFVYIEVSLESLSPLADIDYSSAKRLPYTEVNLLNINTQSAERCDHIVPGENKKIEN